DGGRLPADAHRAGPELGPRVLGDMGDMLQLQPDPPVRPLAEAYLDPAALATELPGGGEAVRRVATLDRAARVALELVAAAHLKVTGDRQEPPPQAVGGGAAVPNGGKGGLVGPAGGDHPGPRPPPHPGADRSPHLP